MVLRTGELSVSEICKLRPNNHLVRIWKEFKMASHVNSPVVEDLCSEALYDLMFCSHCLEILNFLDKKLNLVLNSTNYIVRAEYQMNKMDSRLKDFSDTEFL